MRPIDGDKIGLTDFEIIMCNGDYKEALKMLLNKIDNALTIAQPEIIHCRDCDYWIPGFINDNDNFIPPKCGKYQQMVGHSADDYCNYAERREVSE